MMPRNLCEYYRERLVDLADGELSATEATQVAEHLAACPACRQRLAALRRSLGAAQEVWQTAAEDLEGVGASPRRPALRWWPWAGVGVAAAVLVLALVRFAARPAQRPAPAPEQVARQIADAGLAEQMLVVGRMLAETPGGQSYAVGRYRYIAEHYPATGAAREACTRLGAMTEKG
jgi:predicted anti-sigma-YlaC factor YlaD